MNEPRAAADLAQEMERLIAQWAARVAGLDLAPQRRALLAAERLRLSRAAAAAGTPDFASEPGLSHRLALRDAGRE